jgi:hypothetical protein
MLENAPAIVMEVGDAAIAAGNARVERGRFTHPLETPHAAVGARRMRRGNGWTCNRRLMRTGDCK